MRKLTETEAAWLAGFLDGDGHYYIAKRIIENTVKYQAKISAVGVNSEMIYRCENIAGGGHVRTREPRKEKYNVCFIWEAGPRTLRTLLPQILPYAIKKEQIIRLIRCMELVKNKGRRMGGGYGQESLTETELDELESLKTQIHGLHL